MATTIKKPFCVLVIFVNVCGETRYIFCMSVLLSVENRLKNSCLDSGREALTLPALGVWRQEEISTTYQASPGPHETLLSSCHQTNSFSVSPGLMLKDIK